MSLRGKVSRLIRQLEHRVNDGPGWRRLVSVVIRVNFGKSTFEQYAIFLELSKLALELMELGAALLYHAMVESTSQLDTHTTATRRGSKPSSLDTLFDWFFLPLFSMQIFLVQRKHHLEAVGWYIDVNHRFRYTRHVGDANVKYSVDEEATVAGGLRKRSGRDPLKRSRGYCNRHVIRRLPTTSHR